MASFLGRSRWTLVTVLALGALLLAARLFAPELVRHAVNRRLNRIPNYAGQVGEINLQLWRGAYRIQNVKIVKSSGRVQEPFFAADRIDFSVSWREIFRGRLVSDITVTNGRLSFLRGPTEESSELEADSRWRSAINDIFPIDINHLRIQGGVLRFIDTTRQPRIDIAIRDLDVEATGLRNRPAKDGDKYPAKLTVTGEAFGQGRLRLQAEMAPLAPQTTFQLALELKEVSLPALNDLLRAYARFDVSQGRLEIYGQMAMRDGRYEGYVKPFLDRLDFKDFTGEKKTLGQRIWKSLLVAAINLAKNKTSKQFATRIPFEGEAGALDIRTWKTIENALHHGFVAALPHGFEGTTHPDDRNSKLPPGPESSPAGGAKPGG